MSRRHSLGSAAVAVVLGAILASGCYIGYPPPPDFAEQPVPAAPSGPPGPHRVMFQPRLGIGASVGGGSADDEFLSTGAYVGAQASLWLSDIMAFQLNWGTATFNDNFEWYPGFTGDLTVTPTTVAVIISVPDPFYSSRIFRTRFGIGAGLAELEHSESGVALEDLTVFTVQLGSEWVFAGAGPGAGRLFIVLDWTIGDEVEADMGIETWRWDLSNIVAFRIGLELQF